MSYQNWSVRECPGQYGGKRDLEYPIVFKPLFGMQSSAWKYEAGASPGVGLDEDILRLEITVNQIQRMHEG